MDNIDIKIGKYLSGNITEEELEALFVWVNTSLDNEAYFCEYKNVWLALNMSQETDIDIEKEFSLLQSEIQHQDPSIKVSSVKKVILIWQRIAAILILPIFIAGLLVHLNSVDIPQEIVKTEKKNLVRKTLFTPKGVRAKLKLSDGTQVNLNSNSTLMYTDGLENGIRNVELEGEAYFDVAHDKDHPFVVSARGLKVKVLGTVFNVNTYDPNKIETTLVKGSVQLASVNNMKDSVLLKPGYRAVYKDKTGYIPVGKVNTRYVTAWKDGSILLCDTPMADVIVSLERWYCVEITVRDKEIYNYSFTASLKDKSLSEVLNLLRISSPIGYKINGKDVVIYNKKKK
jgi:ferric-dicitrate binding protein FerR (iron transport regulator)